MYKKTTHEITIYVVPEYLEDQSSPEDHEYLWAYHVRIENHGTHTVQLKSRYWRIIDGFGRIQEVRGEGVIGEQPVLEPGQNFQYTSGTPLGTSSGIMNGSYLMENETGEHFEIEVPSFSLDSYLPMDNVH
jgi:ApaG protein